MYETLIRPHEVYTIPKLVTVSEVRSRLKQAEIKREEKRQRQILAAAAKREKGKRKREDVDTDELGINQSSTTLEDAEDTSKRARLDNEKERDLDGNAPSGSNTIQSATPAAESSNSIEHAPNSIVISEKDLDDNDDTDDNMSSGPATLTVSKPMKEVRGHTSYLTFALLLPPIPTTLEEYKKWSEFEQPSASASTSQPQKAEFTSSDKRDELQPELASSVELAEQQQKIQSLSENESGSSVLAPPEVEKSQENTVNLPEN